MEARNILALEKGKFSVVYYGEQNLSLWNVYITKITGYPLSGTATPDLWYPDFRLAGWMK